MGWTATVRDAHLPGRASQMGKKKTNNNKFNHWLSIYYTLPFYQSWPLSTAAHIPRRGTHMD